jgi:GNAT superfamily N-acetyltransferase
MFGYCVASIQDEEGEIDAIFVDEKYRGKGIGSEFIKDCINWFNENGIKRIKVGVAHGNEATFQFYEKFGLFPRVTYLTTKNWLSEQ